MGERIFVYGTLKSGLKNHHYLAGQKLVGEARTEPVYRMVDCGGYPGMVSAGQDQAGVSVRGEVWEVDAACRVQLDILEDVAVGLYSLEPVRLLAPFDTDDVTTYIYRWPTIGRPDVGEEWLE